MSSRGSDISVPHVIGNFSDSFQLFRSFRLLRIYKDVLAIFLSLWVGNATVPPPILTDFFNDFELVYFIIMPTRVKMETYVVMELVKVESLHMINPSCHSKFLKVYKKKVWKFCGLILKCIQEDIRSESLWWLMESTKRHLVSPPIIKLFSKVTGRHRIVIRRSASASEHIR